MPATLELPLAPVYSNLVARRLGSEKAVSVVLHDTLFKIWLLLSLLSLSCDDPQYHKVAVGELSAPTVKFKDLSLWVLHDDAVSP